MTLLVWIALGVAVAVARRGGHSEAAALRGRLDPPHRPRGLRACSAACTRRVAWLMLFGGNLGRRADLRRDPRRSSRLAFGYPVPYQELLFINMCVSLLSGLIPVPGGIGVTEGGLIFGLTAVGVPQEAAFAAVILYRLSTFYLPPIWGFFSLRWLEKNSYL